jgi:hypothetical protein
LDHRSLAPREKDFAPQTPPLTLGEDAIEFDEYDENAVKNQALQVIYKSLAQKLQGLRNRRKEFVDESERLFLAEYERYCK